MSSIASPLPPKIHIVLLNWNGCDDTLRCVESLRQRVYGNHKIVIIDNGSTDDSAARFRAAPWANDVHLIETGKNLGYAGGNNVGIHHALAQGAEFILVLNNDTTVAPDLLDRLIDAAVRYPDAGVFSARVFYFEEPHKVWFDGAVWNDTRMRLEWPGQDTEESSLSAEDHATDYASGAALFFRTKVARKIGVFDERYFLVWEEVDWCFRAREAGWNCMVIPSAKVWHKIGVSFGSEQSPLRTYFSIRNELLWFSRHASLSARRRLWAKNLRRLTPKFHVSPDPRVSVAKRFVWAMQDYLQAWLGRGSRLEYLATRQAIMDYLHGRLGDCPDEIRAWSRAWATRREALNQKNEP